MSTAYYDPDDWTDVTNLVQTTYTHMVPGQMIHGPNYDQSKSMNGWIMMDPKLDPDAVSAPLRISTLTAISPSIVPLAPPLPQILSIVNHYFSQLQAYFTGSPIYPCLGASLYVYKVDTIESPLLKIFTQILLKAARRTYDIIMDQNLAQEEEFAECYNTHLKELNWCEDISLSTLSASHYTQKVLLQTYISTLLEIIQNNKQSYIDATTLDHFMLTAVNSADEIRLGVLKSSPFYEEIGTQFNLIEQYVLLNNLLARLDYLFSFYMSSVSLTPLLDLTFPDHTINTVNCNMQGIIDGLMHAMNVVWVYNQHIRTENTFFEQIIFGKSLSSAQDINTSVPENSTHEASTFLPEESTTLMTDYKTSFFYQVYQSALNNSAFKTPELPFLSRPAPEPSFIQIQQHFDPFSTYVDKYPNYIPKHEKIIDDINTNLVNMETQVIPSQNTQNDSTKSSILLSSLLPSPCLGLFPYVLLTSVTSTMMMRPFEYPSPVVALETLTISISKLVTTLAAFASILPAKAPESTVAVIDASTKILTPAAKNNPKGKQPVSKAPLPIATTTAPQGTTTTPLHTHIPSYSHIPQLTHFTSLTMPSISSPSNQQLLLPPPLSPYFSYISLSEQLVYIIQTFSTLNPNLYIRSLISSLVCNELDYFGIGRVDTIAEHYLRSANPVLQGWVELPSPAKPLQIFEDFYINGDESTTTPAPVPATTTGPSSAKSKAALIAAAQKSKQLQKQQQKAIQHINQLDDDFFMGHRLSKLSPSQQFTVSFAKIYTDLIKMYISPIHRQRRTLMNNVNTMHTAQVEAEDFDQSSFFPYIKQQGLFPTHTLHPGNPTKMTGHTKGSTPITQWPLYSTTTCLIIEHIINYFINSIQLGMVMGKEYFLFVFILEYLTQHFYDIQRTFSHRVGVKEGVASVGSNKPQLSYHYIAYSTQYAPALSTNTGFFNFPFADQTDPQWKLPQLVTSAQTYGSLRYLPQPLITSTSTLKKKVKYTPDELRSFAFSFPIDDSDFQTYPQYEYRHSEAQWMLKKDAVEPAAAVAVAIPPTKPTTTTKPPAKNTKPQQPATTTSPPVDIKPTTTQLPALFYPPQHPTFMFIRLYHLIFTTHFRLLICAKILGVEFANHILLNTLTYNSETSTFSLQSRTDQILLEQHFSNRYSLLYRSFYPAAQNFEHWLAKTSEIAKEGPKALLTTVSQNVKEIKFKISQFLCLYSGTLPAESTSSEQLSLITRYRDTPNNTVYNQLNKQSTTQPSHQFPLPVVSPIALTDINQFQCQSFLQHVNSSINPLLMYLLKVHNKRASGGKLSISFNTNLIPHHCFAKVLPDFAITEGTEGPPASQ